MYMYIIYKDSPFWLVVLSHLIDQIQTRYRNLGFMVKSHGPKPHEKRPFFVLGPKLLWDLPVSIKNFPEIPQ